MSANDYSRPQRLAKNAILATVVAAGLISVWGATSDLTASQNTHSRQQPQAKLQLPDFDATERSNTNGVPVGFVVHTETTNTSDETYHVQVQPVLKQAGGKDLVQKARSSSIILEPITSSSPVTTSPVTTQTISIQQQESSSSNIENSNARPAANSGMMQLQFIPVDAVKDSLSDSAQAQPLIIDNLSAEPLPAPSEPQPQNTRPFGAEQFDVPSTNMPSGNRGGWNSQQFGGTPSVQNSTPPVTDAPSLPQRQQQVQQQQPQRQLHPQPASPAFERSHASADIDIQSGAGEPPVPTTPYVGHSGFGHQPGTSGFRATVESDSAEWMRPFQQRAQRAIPPSDPMLGVPPQLPLNLSFWWEEQLRQPLNSVAVTHPVNVGTLMQDALQYSPQVSALKAEPEIQRHIVIQEEARFDWSAFLESQWNDLNDPVGNELTTGNGSDRLVTRRVNVGGGFRRRNSLGGEFQVRQQVSHENQNSAFFVPNNQAVSRLELSYRQPLLNGRGQAFNTSQIVLARIDANASEDDVIGALQEHLVQVTEAYWSLYRARAEFLQRNRLLTTARAVLRRLEGRAQLDTIPRQVLRAKAAVARAQTRIQRTLARIRNAESQLRLLVNSPALLNAGHIEVLPMEPPRLVTETAPLQSVLQTALVNRPDISQAIRRMRSAGVRLGVSQNELLPRLDLIVETYVSDLAGNSRLNRALADQFVDNRPGYTLGLNLEIPLGNRLANATVAQRQWELKRSINVFRATVERSLTDVEIAEREVHTAYSEMLSRYESMIAADNESRYLQDRFEVLPSSEESATLLLEDLLDSYERRADEEALFVQAQVDHAIALVNLKQELGILLRSRHDRPQLDRDNSEWIAERFGTSVAASEASQQNNDRHTDVRTTQPQSAFARSFAKPIDGHSIGFPSQAQIARPSANSSSDNSTSNGRLHSSGHSFLNRSPN